VTRKPAAGLPFGYVEGSAPMRSTSARSWPVTRSGFSASVSAPGALSRHSALAERLNCFKSLNPGSRPKTEDVAPGKKQDAGSSKVKDAARAKEKQAAPAKAEQPAPVRRSKRHQQRSSRQHRRRRTSQHRQRQSKRHRQRPSRQQRQSWSSRYRQRPIRQHHVGVFTHEHRALRARGPTRRHLCRSPSKVENTN
jgi:hypothetical protein